LLFLPGRRGAGAERNDGFGGDKNGEAHELGSKFFNKARRGRPPLPENRQKQRVTLHLDPDLLEYFKRGGKGWQTRINAALQEYKGGQ
jgi:uncharacterized protein (DUF4415 family)